MYTSEPKASSFEFLIDSGTVSGLGLIRVVEGPISALPNPKPNDRRCQTLTFMPT